MPTNEGRSIEQYAMVDAHCDEVPVYSFGRIAVYGVSPDFDSNVTLQEGNGHPSRKILPKKSWEISKYHFGFADGAPPRSARGDYQPFNGLSAMNVRWFPIRPSRGFPTTDSVWRGSG